MKWKEDLTQLNIFRLGWEERVLQRFSRPIVFSQHNGPVGKNLVCTSISEGEQLILQHTHDQNSIAEKLLCYGWHNEVRINSHGQELNLKCFHLNYC